MKSSSIISIPSNILEVLKSDYSERFFSLTLENYKRNNSSDETLGKKTYQDIFVKIIKLRVLTDEEVLIFLELLEKDGFQTSYESMLSTFNIQGELLEKVNFLSLKIMLEKLIVKSRVTDLLNGNKNGLVKPEKVLGLEKYSENNYIEINGRLYEQLSPNIFRSTLDEFVKLYHNNDKGNLEEIKGIDNPEDISEVQEGMKGLEGVATFHCYFSRVLRLKGLYSLSTKKSFNFTPPYGMIPKKKSRPDLSRKGRVFVETFNDILSIDLETMVVLAKNHFENFEFGGYEFFIGNISNVSFGYVSCSEMNYYFEFDGSFGINTSIINGIITYGKNGKEKIDLSQVIREKSSRKPPFK